LVDENDTIDAACMKALEGMLEHHTNTERVSVMHAGTLFFFDIHCAGIRPPYEIVAPRPGTGDATWAGQRGN
jgi:hypothetical protein